MFRKLLEVQKRRSAASEARPDRGFTLLELLIAVLISGLVVSGLLYLVTELLRLDNRETALEEVQRDTQRAMNYIADELREAVYVYGTPGAVVDSTTGVGAALPSGSVPILAFWKITPVDDFPASCSSFTDEAKERDCNALKVRRAAYELVVYSQIPGPAASWEGQSRISRYVLRQYQNSATLVTTPGYVDPTLSDSDFQSWEKDSSASLPSSPAGSAVLVDYIDSIGSFADTTVPRVDCQALIPGSDLNEYIVSPSDAPDDSSFFACVRNPSEVAQEDGRTSRSNQDVYLFLRGDASARSSSLNPASEASRAPTLQTQVLIRGVINKEPTN